MRLNVLGNALRPGVKDEVDRLLPLLREHAEIVTVDLYQKEDLSQSKADLALVFGGDGAILRAARQMAYHQIPVLGINLGKLGFLADLSPSQLSGAFPRVAQGEYRVSKHVMFECQVEHPDDGPDGTFKLGLNEIVLHTGPPFHMLDVEIVVNGEGVTRFSGDGLIVSTPIGSTAHNLSAGGPILAQELSAFVITPICPHTLTNRPVVDSADKTYMISILRAGAGTVLIVDGQEMIPMRVGSRVTIRRAPVDFQLVRVAGNSYYQTLRDKLRWGTTPNYREPPTS